MDDLFDGLIHLLSRYGYADTWRLCLGLTVTIALGLGIIFGLDNEAIRWSLGIAVLIIGAILSHLWQRSRAP